MDQVTRTAIAEAWTVLGRSSTYSDQAELDAALEQETERLSAMMWDLSQELHDAELAAYRQANDGEFPPYLEAVAMRQRTMSRAREEILATELEAATEMPASAERTSPEETWEGHPDRWKRAPELLLIDPQEWISDLADEIWPNETLRFQTVAWHLLQTRWEDNQPIPRRPRDPLVPQFTALIEAEVAESAAPESRPI